MAAAYWLGACVLAAACVGSWFVMPAMVAVWVSGLSGAAVIAMLLPP